MSDNGCFLFSELTEFQKSLLKDANLIFPNEYKEFLKIEAKKLLAVEKKIAKKEVGTSKGKKKDWDPKKSYMRKFKTGKIYSFNGCDCVRAYNSSRHAHLIEYGHRIYANGKPTGKYTMGKYILKFAEYEFMDEFSVDCEKFLFNHFENARGTRF